MAVRTLLKQLIHLSVVVLIVAFTSVNSSANVGINTQQAHEVIRSQHHHLLGDGKDLVSLYYFGAQQIEDSATTVIGLERVGDDYLPVRWLLIFENDDLLGWYHPVAEFPMSFKNGTIKFPKGLTDGPVSLTPAPPASLSLQGIDVQFHKPAGPVNH